MAHEINFPFIIRRHARALLSGPHDINSFFWEVEPEDLFFFLFSFFFFVFLEPEDQRSWVEAHLYNFCSLSACFLLLVSKCKVPKRKRINSKKIFYNGYFHLWLVRSIRETSSLKSITLCLIKFAHLKKNIFK